MISDEGNPYAEPAAVPEDPSLGRPVLFKVALGVATVSLAATLMLSAITVMPDAEVGLNILRAAGMVLTFVSFVCACTFAPRGNASSRPASEPGQTNSQHGEEPVPRDPTKMQ